MNLVHIWNHIWKEIFANFNDSGREQWEYRTFALNKVKEKVMLWAVRRQSLIVWVSFRDMEDVTEREINLIHIALENIWRSWEFRGYLKESDCKSFKEGTFWQLMMPKKRLDHHEILFCCWLFLSTIVDRVYTTWIETKVHWIQV